MNNISKTYIDICPECEAWDIKMINIEDRWINHEITDVREYRRYSTFVCRECFAEWEDFSVIEPTI